MSQMVFKGLAVNQYIIEEDDNEFTQVGLKRCVHQCLKRGGGIAQAKGYNTKFIMPLMSVEDCFMNVFFIH